MLSSFLDRMNINSAFKYRIMFIAGAAMHSVFLIVFLAKGILTLVFINIISVLLYGAGSLFSVNKKESTVRYGWMITFYSEILLHSVLSTLLIGVETGFQLYAIAALPVAIYMLFFSCKIEKFIITIMAFVAACVLSLIASSVAVKNIEGLPYYPLSYADIEFMRTLNMVFTGVLLVFFSMLFALEIYSLLRRLNETNSRLEYTASHDALTGLYNRHSLKPFFDELENEGKHFCVALGDIDDFKQVNDTYGHDGGDKVLKTVTSVISEGIGGQDIACRWGGEEILIILRGGREECLERIKTIRGNIVAREVSHEDKSIKVTMTFGFAECTEGKSIQALVSAADKRLYMGKAGGKNVIVDTDDS